MKQKKSLKLVLCVVIVLITNFNCSKKDAIQRDNFELKTMVNSIRNWYDSSKQSIRKHESSKTIVTQSNQTEVEQLIFDDISWDKALLHFDSSSRKGIKIPVLRNEITGERIELASLYHNGKVKGYFVQLKPTREWYLKNKQKGNYQYVDGEMNIFSVKGKFLEKIILEKGMLKKTATEINSQTESRVTYTDQTIIEGGEDLDGVTVVGHPHHSTPGYYSFYFLDIINPNSGSSDEDSVPYDNSGGGSGGDGGDSNQEVEIDSLLKIIHSPCIDSTFQKLTSDKLKNQISKMYNETFTGNSNKFNLTIWEVSSLPNNAKAQSQISMTNIDTWEIFLNSSFANQLTEEFWGSIILHELVHGFIDKNNLGFNQYSSLDLAHKNMLENWISQIQSALEEIYFMPKSEALALSLQGFDDILKDRTSGAFKTEMKVWISQKYNMDLDTSTLIANDYITGIKGKKCTN